MFCKNSFAPTSHFDRPQALSPPTLARRRGRAPGVMWFSLASSRFEARWTVQTRTRPIFGRQAHQLLCLYDDPWGPGDPDPAIQATRRSRRPRRPDDPGDPTHRRRHENGELTPPRRFTRTPFRLPKILPGDQKSRRHHGPSGEDPLCAAGSSPASSHSPLCRWVFARIVALSLGTAPRGRQPGHNSPSGHTLSGRPLGGGRPAS